LKEVTSLIVIVIVTAFVYFCPWVYGYPLSNQQIASRRWMSGWN
jgi:dolichyl-phosphate-mannose--protein O-mannosyl transferase